MVAVGKSRLGGDLFDGKMDVRKEHQGLFKTAFHGVVDGGDTGLLFEKMTEGAIKLTPGTMYGSLSKMEKDGVIRFVGEEDKRKIYQITELGLEVLQIELKRIERLYKIAQEAAQYENEEAI